MCQYTTAQRRDSRHDPDLCIIAPHSNTPFSPAPALIPALLLLAPPHPPIHRARGPLHESPRPLPPAVRGVARLLLHLQFERAMARQQRDATLERGVERDVCGRVGGGRVEREDAVGSLVVELGRDAPVAGVCGDGEGAPGVVEVAGVEVDRGGDWAVRAETWGGSREGSREGRDGTYELEVRIVRLVGIGRLSSWYRLTCAETMSFEVSMRRELYAW